MDETAIALDPVLRKCWMKKGAQHTVPAPAKRHQSFTVMGGYNWREDTICWSLPDRSNSEGMVTWLEHLMLACYPTEFVVLVMDNASIHRSKMTQAAIALFEHRLLVVYLPPYASQLNPIERYWRHLKDQICANKLHPDLDTLCDEVVKEFKRQNDAEYENRFQMCK